MIPAHKTLSANDTALCAHDIRKSFAGVCVLSGVMFDIRRGEVHTLMGENGAGKSTLMNILAGVHRPDAGVIELDGQPIELQSPAAALSAGIALIHQEPQSFPDLSIAENICLGRGMPRGVLGQIDWRTMHRRTREVLSSLGITLAPGRRMNGLSIADQQMIELAAALAQDAKVLLMDEPTAALTPGEVDRLFAIVRTLRERGVAIVFISHRLPEVFQISDRITVLRDGGFVGTKAVRETSQAEIVRMMVGRPLGEVYERKPTTPGAVRLRVSGLSAGERFRDIDLDVRAGEIVGIAGLVGAGRTEVAEAIFGVAPKTTGQIEVDGRAVTIASPADAIRHGIAYVPEDRQRNGLLLPMSICQNTSLASLQDVSRGTVLSGSRERSLGERWKQTLQTRLRSVDQPVRELSGGNQQKVVLAKWLQTQPKVLIVDEPTRGIDIGAKAEVHHVLSELAEKGCAILMISSDLPEVLAMSDRILVMRQGEIAGRFSRSEATQENVMAAAVGTERVTANVSHGGSSGRGAGEVHPVARRWIDAILNVREAGVVLFLLVALIGIGLYEPRFWSKENLISVAKFVPLYLIVAIGQLIVIVSRNIDLSVGSILALSAIITCGMFVSSPNLPIGVAALLATGIGVLLGAVNGGLIAFLRVPAIIATLGTLTAYRGLTFIYSGGKQVNPDELPHRLIRLSQEGPLDIAWLIWIALAIAGLMALFLRYTRAGRCIFAVGSNPRAATLRGLPVRGTVLLVFMISGALAGLAGLLFGSRFPTVNPSSVGASFELVVISAVVIGGAAVAGGSGSVLGTLLGCVLLAIVNVGLSVMKTTEYWQLLIYGLAILLAATLDATLRSRKGVAR